MSRTPPAGADAALIADLARLNITVTHAQLERWRAIDYLTRRRPGRPPADDVHPPGTLALVAQLAVASRQGRSLGAVGWCFWAKHASPRAARRLRAALLQTLDTYGARLGVRPDAPARDSDAADDEWQARSNAATALVQSVRRGPDLHTLLSTAVRDSGEQLEETPGALPSVNRPAILHLMARLLAGGAADVPAGEFLDEIQEGFPELAETVDDIQGRRRQRELAGNHDLWAKGPLADGWAGLRRAVVDAHGDRLCRAVELNTAASAALAFVITGFTPQGESMPPRALAYAMADPMWEQWGRHMPLPQLHATWRTVIAVQSAFTLILPGRQDELRRYRGQLEQLLQLAPTETPFEGQRESVHTGNFSSGRASPQPSEGR